MTRPVACEPASATPPGKSPGGREQPLRVLFLLTSMPVGGAETLLANLVRRIDRRRFAPEIICLKEPGPLGEELAAELPVHSRLLGGKWDAAVLWRLMRLMRSPRTDAVITVGAGDKMFWGRLAAHFVGVPAIASALHSTGWPDGVGRLNRLLTPWTDAFIAVATPHAQHLVEQERFPAAKVCTIFNGVDVERFAPQSPAAAKQALGIDPTAPTVGIVAALRPEKNHELFLRGAAAIRRRLPRAQFLIVGDGPRRSELESLTSALALHDAVRFLGTRGDVAPTLAACDLFALTSHNEASPVSILEALSMEIPVVAPRVGSIPETVIDGVTGETFDAGDESAFVERCLTLLADQSLARRLGAEGRRRVVSGRSLQAMVAGYEELIERLVHAGRPAVAAASRAARWPRWSEAHA